MKNKKIAEALNEIDDRYLNDATKPHVRRPYWIAAVAAVLAVIITISVLPGPSSEPNLEIPGPNTSQTTNNQDPSQGNPLLPDTPSDPLDNAGGIDLSPLQILPDLLRAPTIPNLVQFPIRENYAGNLEEYNLAIGQWQSSQFSQYNQPEGYADSLTDFFRRSITQFLSAEENGTYSPVNVYLAMAMLAETTAGDSRQQILDLFGVDSIEQLRTQAGYLWNAHFNNDGQTTLLLANSLWLDSMYSFNPDTVNRLSENYYASVFGADLGTEESNAQLRTWLNTMTGGLLEEQAQDTALTPGAVFALVSTIYFKAGWMNEFSKSQTAEETFHAPDGDVLTEFMRNRQEGVIYRGSNFSAVRLELTGNNGMWIILPDEGVTVSQILSGDEYLEMTLNPDAWTDKRNCTLNISLPKFDIACKTDLIEGMKSLGLSHIFDPDLSNFTPMTTDSDRLAVSQIDHAARVIIDEEGVIAAAYTVIGVYGESMKPIDVVEFRVDRPFAFIVSSQDYLPLFAGVVADP